VPAAGLGELAGTASAGTGTGDTGGCCRARSLAGSGCRALSSDTCKLAPGAERGRRAAVRCGSGRHKLHFLRPSAAVCCTLWAVFAHLSAFDGHARREDGAVLPASDLYQQEVSCDF